MKTPLTDKYKGTWASRGQDGVSIFQHAQNLEQERDEARAIAAQMREHNGYKSNDEAIFPWENMKDSNK